MQIEKRETIAIFGDYDVGGENSTAVLPNPALCGIDDDPHPDSLFEGHGRIQKPCARLAEKGTAALVRSDADDKRSAARLSRKSSAFDVGRIDHS